MVRPKKRHILMCSFFILEMGDGMKLYLDVLFGLNMGFDFLLLITVSYLLNRKTSFKRLFLGSLFGGITIFILFLPLNSFTLFLYKVIVSIVMTLITFSYRDLKFTLKNLFYLYMTSMVYGGFLYFLNTEFSYKQVGLIFYHEGLSINFIFLLVFSPIILYLYVKQIKWLKEERSYYHSFSILFDESLKQIEGVSFLDTGNQIIDPYQNRPVVLLDKRRFIYDLNRFKLILVPITTASGSTLLRCIQPKEMKIDGIAVQQKVLIGLLDEKISLDGVDAILSLKIMEGL